MYAPLGDVIFAVNSGPLSVVMSSGMPKVTKMERRLDTRAVAVGRVGSAGEAATMTT